MLKNIPKKFYLLFFKILVSKVENSNLWTSSFVQARYYYLESLSKNLEKGSISIVMHELKDE